MVNRGPQQKTCITSVRLEPQRTHELLNALDKPAAGVPAPAVAAANHNRSVRAARRIFNLRASITQPGGAPTVFAVVSRNISSRGLAFIHGHFVHVGSRFEAVLPSLDRQTITQVTGQVVRCRHVTGMIHEVAVRFDQGIDLPLFAQLTPEDEQRLWNDIESVAPAGDGPAAMSGSALVIDAQAARRATTAGWMGRLGFNTKEACDAPAAAALMKDAKVDIILAELPSGDEGVLLCRALRTHGFAGQLVAVTGDGETAEKLSAGGCDALIPGPLTGRTLFETISRLVDRRCEGDDSAAPLRSSLEFDLAMKPLIVEFVGKCPAAAAALTEDAKARDMDKIKAACVSLKAEGGGHGFWQITRFADDVLSSLGGDEAETLRRVARLAALLRRVAFGDSAA